MPSHRVLFEIDARYRFDASEKRHIEVCPACGLDRRHAEERCPCGREFTRNKRGFFSLKWEPAQIQLRYPARCPHCLGPTEKTIILQNSQYNHWMTGLGPQQTTLAQQVPVCKRVRSPAWLRLALIISVFWLVVAVLALAFAVIDQPWRVWGAWAVVGLLSATATAWLWRAQSWIRFTRFDHRAFVFRVRRREYATEFARLNGGRE